MSRTGRGPESLPCPYGHPRQAELRLECPVHGIYYCGPSRVAVIRCPYCELKQTLPKVGEIPKPK